MKSKTKFKQTEIGLIPEDWEIKKLHELLFIKGRIGWKGLKRSEFGQHGIIIINGPNIQNGVIDWKKCMRVPKWRYDESYEIAVQKNDIIMTKDGTIGKTAYIKYLPEPATLASGIFLIRSTSEKLDQDFLYQYFNSVYFKELAESRIEGSVIPHLYQRDIEQLLIPLPPPTEQEHIAKILSDLNSKIDLNQRMNKILEQIAQTVFKSWFVDYEFPDEDGKPYRSSGGTMVYDVELEKEIPKGWEISTIHKEFNLVMGQSPPGNSYNEIGTGIVFFQGRTNFGDRFPAIRMFCTKPTRFAKKDDTLVSVRAPVGDVNRALQDCCIGRGLSAIRHKSDDSSYTYYFMMNLKPIFENFDAQGTVFGSITKIDFEQIQVLSPSIKILHQFKKTVGSIDKKIETNILENLALHQLRDLLLLKLMSGQIRV